ncbi:MAG: hypothetical protein SFV54_22245 [Bryobacteraceae bacterium]|nr:hypothetical protein [Bryobacteraceae bacterium]
MIDSLDLDRARRRASTLGSRHAPTPEIATVGIEMIVHGLRLEPDAQWAAALNYNSLISPTPNLAIWDPGVMSRTEEAFLAGTPNDADHWCLAWRLMCDAWCSLFEHDKLKLQPQIVQIAEGVDHHPGIQVARAIRRLARGETDSVDALWELARQPDCRRVFEAAGWFKADARESAKAKARPRRKPKP